MNLNQDLMKGTTAKYLIAAVPEITYGYLLVITAKPSLVSFVAALIPFA